jgi:hypothetical protein
MAAEQLLAGPFHIIGAIIMATVSVRSAFSVMRPRGARAFGARPAQIN